MREKIIKRFAAGTIGVCFAYALIRQNRSLLCIRADTSAVCGNERSQGINKF